MSFMRTVQSRTKYGSEPRVIASQAQLTTSKAIHISSGKFISPTHAVRTKGLSK